MTILLLAVLMIVAALVAAVLFEGPVSTYVDQTHDQEITLRGVWCIVLVVLSITVMIVGAAGGIILLIYGFNS